MIAAAATFPQTVTGYAVVFGIVVLVLNQLGLLDRLGLKGKSASDAAAELDVADRLAKRLRDERNQAREEAAKLALQRTNEPVLEVLAKIAEQLGQNSASQAEVLDRLASHNGSFAHMEKTLGLVADGFKALLGTIAELHDIPLREKP